MDNTAGARVQGVGAIQITSARTNNHFVGNSSTSAGAHGFLRLFGVVVDGEANTILSHNGSANFTIQNTQGSGNQTMGLQLQNTTNSKIVLRGSGNIIISSIVSSVASATPLTIQGSGTGFVSITNANTFVGDIFVNGAEVRFSGDASLGHVNNNIIIDGGIFAAADTAVFTIASTRNIEIGDTAGTSISTPGGSTQLTYNGSIADKMGATGSWAKQGEGVLELGGVSTYTGDTAIQNGTLRLINGDNRLPTDTVVSLGQTSSSTLGTFDLNGNNQEIAGLNSVTGTNAGVFQNRVTSSTAAALTIGGSGDYSYGDGTSQNSGRIRGDISLVKNGIGTQTLGDPNTYTGDTTVNSGKLIVASTGSINSSANAASELAVTGGELQIDNGGSVTVGNSATVSGGAIVTANGTLVVPTLDVNNGTLQGSGTVTANTTIASNGTLSPGNSVGELTIGSSLSVAGTYRWDVDFGSDTADLTRVLSALNLTGATLDLVQTGTFAAGKTFSLFAYTGTLTSCLTSPSSNWIITCGATMPGLNFMGDPSGFGFVNIESVPEWNSLAYVFLIVLGVGLIRVTIQFARRTFARINTAM